MSAVPASSVGSWIADFLRDGLNGNNSSSRLVSVGAATILAFYIALDAIDRVLVQIAVMFFNVPNPASVGMNETGLVTAMGGLVALGSATYTANKWAGVKKASTTEEQDKSKNV